MRFTCGQPEPTSTLVNTAFEGVWCNMEQPWAAARRTYVKMFVIGFDAITAGFVDSVLKEAKHHDLRRYDTLSGTCRERF